MEDNIEIVNLYLYFYFYREKETPPALVQLSLKYESMTFSSYSHIISCTCSSRVIRVRIGHQYPCPVVDGN